MNSKYGRIESCTGKCNIGISDMITQYSICRVMDIYRQMILPRARFFLTIGKCHHSLFQKLLQFEFLSACHTANNTDFRLLEELIHLISNSSSGLCLRRGYFMTSYRYILYQRRKKRICLDTERDETGNSKICRRIMLGCSCAQC